MQRLDMIVEQIIELQQSIGELTRTNKIQATSLKNEIKKNETLQRKLNETQRELESTKISLHRKWDAETKSSEPVRAREESYRKRIETMEDVIRVMFAEKNALLRKLGLPLQEVNYGTTSNTK